MDKWINTNKIISLKKLRPKWINSVIKNTGNTFVRFGKEINSYYLYNSPLGKMMEARIETCNILDEILNQYLPNWFAQTFGSYEQGLSTLNSDIDFVLYNTLCFDYNDKITVNNDPKMLKKKELEDLKTIKSILEKNEFSTNIDFIDKARVPILSGTCKKTGIKFDISVNREGGYEAAEKIKDILDKYPFIKQLMIILKIMIKQNNMNNPRKGGMNSFVLFHLIYYFCMKDTGRTGQNKLEEYKAHKNKIDNGNEVEEDFIPNFLTVCLLKFLRFYGIYNISNKIHISIKENKVDVLSNINPKVPLYIESFINPGINLLISHGIVHIPR